MASQRDTITAMDTWLTGKGSPLAGFSDFAVILARYHGLSISLSLGIAQAETQCGTDTNMSPLDLTGHNVWGYGHPPGSTHGWQFGSWPDGISAVTQFLAEFYVYRGMDTVQKVCPIWVGRYSASWVDAVSSIMRQFGGDPNKLARAPLARPPA